MSREAAFVRLVPHKTMDNWVWVEAKHTCIGKRGKTLRVEFGWDGGHKGTPELCGCCAVVPKDEWERGEARQVWEAVRRLEGREVGG